jgi:hypothetical protein
MPTIVFARRTACGGAVIAIAGEDGNGRRCRGAGGVGGVAVQERHGAGRVVVTLPIVAAIVASAGDVLLLHVAGAGG